MEQYSMLAKSIFQSECGKPFVADLCLAVVKGLPKFYVETTGMHENVRMALVLDSSNTESLACGTAGTPPTYSANFLHLDWKPSMGKKKAKKARTGPKSTTLDEAQFDALSLAHARQSSLDRIAASSELRANFMRDRFSMQLFASSEQTPSIPSH
ncbi:hypothetical protein Ae201684P_009024 [Aphanomyces euteiches]|nr:hypothetical protein Ae201684P_009024 [Aphanomyces euteiches]KAH9142078.1 hypothetical protein AeRB84_013821 [Aphanomyces euteiches]